MTSSDNDHPKYLKKIGAPNNDYHLWTPYLEARGDMLPYSPPELEHRILMVTKGGYKLQHYSPRHFRILDSMSEVVAKGLTKQDALAWLVDHGETEVEAENDTTGTSGEDQEKD